MRLRAVREELKLRQVDVAVKLGMSAGGYSSVERGHARMFITDIQRYAEALGVEPAYLSRRLGLCGVDGDPEPADIAHVLVERFGPQLGSTLVRLDRLSAMIEHGDTAALNIVVDSMLRKYEPATAG